MSISANDSTATTLKPSWAREWIILAGFVLLASYGFWAIWQPQDNLENRGNAQGAGDPAAAPTVAKAGGDPTGG